MHIHDTLHNDAYTTGHVHMHGAVRNGTYDTCDAYTTGHVHMHGAVRNGTYATCDAYTTGHVHMHGAVRNGTYDTCDAYATRRLRRIRDRTLRAREPFLVSHTFRYANFTGKNQ